MCCHQGTLLSGSSKLVAMDLRAFRGFGATLSFIAMEDCQDSLKVFVKQVKPRLDFYFSMLLQETRLGGPGVAHAAAKPRVSPLQPRVSPL